MSTIMQLSTALKADFKKGASAKRLAACLMLVLLCSHDHALLKSSAGSQLDALSAVAGHSRSR